jgi:hypothetical protein
VTFRGTPVVGVRRSALIDLTCPLTIPHPNGHANKLASSGACDPQQRQRRRRRRRRRRRPIAPTREEADTDTARRRRSRGGHRLDSGGCCFSSGRIRRRPVGPCPLPLRGRVHVEAWRRGRRFQQAAAAAVGHSCTQCCFSQCLLLLLLARCRRTSTIILPAAQDRVRDGERHEGMCVRALQKRTSLSGVCVAYSFNRFRISRPHTVPSCPSFANRRER